MASALNIPSSILVSVLDEEKDNFPLEMALVVMKNIFKFGVKDIFIQDRLIFISLTYCPRQSTLLRKFGNLPVKFMRTQLESERDLRLLQQATARYQFDLDGEEEPEASMAIQNNPMAAIEPTAGPSTQGGQNKRSIKDKSQKRKKVKILSNEILLPAKGTTTTAATPTEKEDSIIVNISDEEGNDDDDDDDFRFESQAF